MKYAEKTSEKIKQLLKDNNMSVTQLSNEIGLPQTTLNTGLSSKKGLPIDTLIKIADYFNVTVPILCGKEDISIESSNEKDARLNIIIDRFNCINELGKEKLLEYSEDLMGNPKYAITEDDTESYSSVS